jgi:hypothetical protein
MHPNRDVPYLLKTETTKFETLGLRLKLKSKHGVENSASSHGLKIKNQNQNHGLIL